MSVRILLVLLLSLFAGSAPAEVFYTQKQVVVSLRSYDPQACSSPTHDDRAAFLAFNADYTKGGPKYAGDTAKTVLTIPPATCYGIDPSGIWPAAGIPDFICFCKGVTFDKSLNIEPGPVHNFFDAFDQTKIVPIQTVLAGSKCVTVITLSDATKFNVGDWTVAGGLNLQEFSFPPNLGFYDYLRITSVNNGTGVICFSSPVSNTLKSTWPNISSPNELTYGAASLFVGFTGTADAATGNGGGFGWGNVCATWFGVTWGQPGETFGSGRCLRFINNTFIGCPVPSGSGAIYHINSVFVNPPTNCTDLEVDKEVDLLDFENATGLGINIQSMSVKQLICNNSTFAHIVGTPTSFVGSNCNATQQWNPGGPNGYGQSTSFICNGCSFPFSVDIVAPTIEIKGSQSISNSIANGVITINPSGDPALQWAVPGKSYFFGIAGGHPTNIHSYGYTFHVLDLIIDGQGNTKVYTDLTSLYGLSGYPPVPADLGNGGELQIVGYPAPQFSVPNCSGNITICSQKGAPLGSPYGTFNQVTFGCTQMASPFGGSSEGALHVLGGLKQATYNVTVADTTQTSLGVLAENVPTITFTGSKAVYAPIVNLKVTGTRTVSPGGISGLQSGDSIITPGTSWFTIPDVFGLNTGSDPKNDSPCPSITLTIQTSASIP